MKKLKNTNETAEINKPVKFTCEFCNREFARESTILKHICESKQRWLQKDMQGNRIAYQTFIQFYKKHTAYKKQKTQLEFIKSAYYVAFVKFGNYCVDVNCVNIPRYVDWLLKNQISIDSWASDKNYNKFLIEYLRIEDAMDAIKRSVEYSIILAEKEGIKTNDVLRYGNPNRICYAITLGKLSPWLLFQSESGVRFLETLNPDHAKMIMEYIDPEQWALKFHREPENVRTVKEILAHGGY